MQVKKQSFDRGLETSCREQTGAGRPLAGQFNTFLFLGGIHNMKKLISLLLALIMVFSLGAIAFADDAPEIKVGIAAPDVTHGWVAGVAYYAEKYCKDNDLEYMITTSSDAAEMTTALDDLVG